MTSYSLTKITTHEKCALKYKFRYILNLPSAKSETAQRGIDSHKYIEDKLKINAPLPAQLSHYDTWLTQLQGEGCFPEHKIAVDKNWELCGFEDPEAYIRSVLDLKYVVSPQEIAIYDWKTGKIYDDHADQKRLYSAMAFAEHPTVYSIKAIHVYVDLGKNVEMGFHRDQIAALRAHWDQRIRNLELDVEFIPSPGYHCKWCTYSRAAGGPCRF